MVARTGVAALSKRACKPGSITGACPAKRSVMGFGLASAPMTSKPLLASTAAKGAPSLPRPRTEIRRGGSVGDVMSETYIYNMLILSKPLIPCQRTPDNLRGRLNQEFHFQFKHLS